MKIRLFCNAGVGNFAHDGLLLDADIVAYPLNELDRHIEGINVALLGPQVGYQKKSPTSTTSRSMSFQ